MTTSSPSATTYGATATTVDVKATTMYSSEHPARAASDDARSDDDGRPARTVTVWRFAVIAFFLVCGGPFGIETVVASGGAPLALLSFCALPFVWALPQAMMTAELSTMMNDNGGYVLWVQVAFGDLAGWLCGFNGVLASIVDLALYPTLFVDYAMGSVLAADVATSEQRVAIKVAIVLLCLVLNLYGLEAVGWVSALLTVCVIAPFVVLLLLACVREPATMMTLHDVVYAHAGGPVCAASASANAYTAELSSASLWARAAPTTELLSSASASLLSPLEPLSSLATSLSSTVGDAAAATTAAASTTTTVCVRWGVFLSSSMWNYTGFDSLGCIAAEVVDPQHTYIRGTLATLALITLTYGVPVVMFWQLHPNTSRWHDGDLARFASALSPSVGLWVSIASMFANIGMFQVELAANARAVWALAGGDRHSSMPVHHIPRVFGITWRRFGTPVVSLLVHAVAVLALLRYEFAFLVQADMLCCCIRLFLEFCAFVSLRVTSPRRERMYKVPWGWSGVALITVPKMIIVLAIFATSDASLWRTAVLMNAGAVAWYFAARVVTDKYRGRPLLQFARDADFVTVPHTLMPPLTRGGVIDEDVEAAPAALSVDDDVDVAPAIAAAAAAVEAGERDPVLLPVQVFSPALAPATAGDAPPPLSVVDTSSTDRLPLTPSPPAALASPTTPSFFESFHSYTRTPLVAGLKALDGTVEALLELDANISDNGDARPRTSSATASPPPVEAAVTESTSLLSGGGSSSSSSSSSSIGVGSTIMSWLSAAHTNEDTQS